MTEPHDFAFPVSNRRDVPTETSVGLTKRELFAAMMLSGLCSQVPSYSFNAALPEYAVMYADALISELNKEQK